MVVDNRWNIEPYIDTNTGKALRIPEIKRDDGFAIKAIGLGREFDETFLVKGDFGEFEIRASRWNEKEQRPNDVYIVKTWCHKDTKKLCLKYSEDIESALLQYPIFYPFFNNIPIREVVFDVGIGRELKYVHAKDIKIDDIA